MTSSISPARKSDKEERHYSLLPSAQNTVPVPVLPNNHPSELLSNGNSGASKMSNSLHHYSDTPPRFKKGEGGCLTNLQFSWRCLTLCLAAVLLFSLGVICYLVVCQTTHSIPSSSAAAVAVSGRPLPESFSMGDPVAAELTAGQSHTYFVVKRDSHVQFNLSVEPQAKLGVYGRRTLQASPTEYTFSHIIHGRKLHASTGRNKRSVAYGYNFNQNDNNMRSTSFVEQLSAGHWYITFLNDGNQPSALRFSAAPIEMTERCPSDCFGRGLCKAGRCHCYKGSTGPFCDKQICPDLCSGHGQFGSGRCHCNEGWKGLECGTPSNVCEVPNCNGNGICTSDGTCKCKKEFTGKFCEEKACSDPKCSGHGICMKGKCYCMPGWLGANCQIKYGSAGIGNSLCPYQKDRSTSVCSGHGQFDPYNDKCTCNEGWIGDQCEIKLCSMDCGQHGRCENDACRCHKGWQGDKCQERTCLPGCEDHGKCLNGTCKCDKGFEGENCQLEGCPNDCSKRGKCAKLGAYGWRCSCMDLYTGYDCSIPMEFECSDRIDNDGDGLTDCEDSECCGMSACRDHMHCQSVSRPERVLMRKQPPPPGASFFEKAKFFLDPDSVQQYAEVNKFNQSQASIVRGRVIHKSGGGLLGVRISDANEALQGFTLSRSNGQFDLMVNGGGSVKIQFLRQPLKSLYITVRVPWNRIVYVGDVVMVNDVDANVEGKKNQQFLPLPILPSESCQHLHNPSVIKPIILPSWKFAQFGGKPGFSGVLADAQASYSSIPIYGTGIYLIYTSTQADGYQSTLWLSLLPSQPPESLRKVTLKIDIEGYHFEKMLAAKSNLTYSFSWDKRNIYSQTVYGLTTAQVSVGYIYEGCAETFWTILDTSAAGALMSISDVGKWNLDIHHHLDISGGVLQKGDGCLRYMKEEGMVVGTLLGNGDQRSISCPHCNGDVSNARLFLPLTLATGMDGSLFIGDYNLIRKVKPDGSVWTVLELSPADTAHPYFLAVNPLGGHLFISLPLKRQVWRILTEPDDSGPPVNPRTNYEVAVGRGEPCLVGDECGENGPATMAKLSYPKGMAFNSKGDLYLADERRILAIQNAGTSYPSRVVTLVKSPAFDQTSASKDPASACQLDISLRDLNLHWPTYVSVLATDESVLVLDNGVVYQMNWNGTAAIRAGAPGHCMELVANYSKSSELYQRQSEPLRNAVAMTTSPSGDILIVESDRRRRNRILTIKPTENKLTFLAGQDSTCDCDRKNCPCDDSENILAQHAHFHSPEAIAVSPSPEGTVYIADKGNLKIRQLRPSIPQMDRKTKLYEIYDHDAQEVYSFNRYGHHVSTKNLLTGLHFYNFSYNIDTKFAKLVRVTGLGGFGLFIGRQGSSDTSQVFLENSNGLQTKLYANQFGIIDRVSQPDRSEIRFAYEPGTGLMLSQSDSRGHVTFYDYDYTGRLSKAVTATGEVYHLKAAISENQVQTEVTRADGTIVGKYKLGEAHIEVDGGTSKHHIFKTMSRNGKGFQIRDDLTGESVLYDSMDHSLIGDHHSSILGRKVTIPLTMEPARPAFSQKLLWRYRLSGRGSAQVGRLPRVNGVDAIEISYTKTINRDAISIPDKGSSHPVMDLSYNSAGQLVEWHPSSKLQLSDMSISYDAIGRVKAQTWGGLHVDYIYDHLGRLIQTTWHGEDENHVRKYEYSGELQTPSSVQLASEAYQGHFKLKYDQTGALQEILTPGKLSHRFFLHVEFGQRSELYFPPGGRLPFIRSVNGHGNLIDLRTPSQLRRVTNLYDAEGIRLVHSFYGYLSFDSIDYLPSSSLPIAHRSSQWNKAFSRKVSYEYQGSLPTQVSEIRKLFDSNAQILHIGYHYDSNMRISSIQVTHNGVVIQPLEFTFDSKSGNIQSLGSRFKFSRSGAKQTVVSNRFLLETTTSNSGLTFKQIFSIQGRKLLTQTIYYNKLGYVAQINSLSSAGEEQKAIYGYSIEGQLTTMESGKTTWNYVYSIDGHLKSINNQSLVYDSKTGHLTSGRLIKYSTDSTGCVIRKGNQVFEYDGFGRLVIAKEPNEYFSHYFYDSQHRVIAWKSKWGNRNYLKHLYYLYPNTPNLVSHEIDPSTNQISVFYYDFNNRLFAYEQDGQYHYVATAIDGSPLAVFSADGTLLKSMEWSPTGEITADTAPVLWLPIGYQGQFYDPANRLILGQQPYDPFTGKFLCVSADVIFNKLSTFEPEFLTSLWSQEPGFGKIVNFPTSFSEMMKLSGVNTDSLLGYSPDSPDPLTSHLCPSGSLFNLGSKCALFRQLSILDQRNTLRPSKLLGITNSHLSRPLHAKLQLAESVYGEGVTLSNVSGMAVLDVLDHVDGLYQSAVMKYLNKSTIVPYSKYDSSLRRIHYFVKPDAKEEVIALSLSPKLSETALSPFVNLTNPKDSIYHLETRFSKIIISTQTVDLPRLLSSSRSRAINLAWKQEKHFARLGLTLRRSWSPKDRNTILTNGHVSLKVQPAFPNPELADNPNFIQFL